VLKVIYHSNFLITINRKKRKAAPKNEAGRDEKHLFVLLGLTELYEDIPAFFMLSFDFMDE